MSTHLSHITEHHPFENKVYSFVIKVVHYQLMMFLHICVYLYMYTCNCIVAIQHNFSKLLFLLLYRQGGWYTLKNECLIYLFSSCIRRSQIHTKKKHSAIWYKQLTREFTRYWGGSKCCIAKPSKISPDINQLIKSRVFVARPTKGNF